MSTRKGFTLIELMVVVAIIAILTSVVLGNLAGSSGKSRDARRQADIKQLAGALEVYYSLNKTYPTCNGYTTDTAGAIQSMTCLSSALVGAGLFSSGSFPRDPQYPNKSYIYANTCNSPAGNSVYRYRLYVATETDMGGTSVWGGANFLGSTNCTDPT